MTVYIVATLLACGAAWMASRAEGRARKAWIFASAVPLTAVAALRWGLGTDQDLTYLPVFQALRWVRGGGGTELADALFQPLKDGLCRRPLIMTPLEEAEHWTEILGTMEPGYRAILEAAAAFGGSFRTVTVVTSILTAALVFTAIWRQSGSPALAIYFYVATSNYFLSLNIVRQYMAVGFVLLALPAVLDRRPWRFLLCVAAAALFHRTALIVLPCWLLGRFEVRPRVWFALVAASLAASGFAAPAARAVMPCLGFGHYVRYFTRYADDGFEYFFFAINLCFLAAGALYWTRAKTGCRLFSVWYGATALGTVALAFSGTLPLMKRVNYYFAAPQFLMLPELLAAEERPRLRRALTVFAILAFAAETFVAVWLLNKNEPLPYRIFPT